MLNGQKLQGWFDSWYPMHVYMYGLVLQWGVGSGQMLEVLYPVDVLYVWGQVLGVL